jgi:hypothetical protein
LYPVATLIKRFFYQAQAKFTVISGRAYYKQSLPKKTSDSCQAQIAKWKQHVQDYSKNRFNINNVIPNLEDGKTDITQITGFDDTEQLRRIILSFRGTFLYII